MQTCDVLIVGAGIAGASAAYEIAPFAEVILLERESQPGYHATGRSAAVFAPAYGNRVIRALTAASGAAARSRAGAGPRIRRRRVVRPDQPGAGRGGDPSGLPERPAGARRHHRHRCRGERDQQRSRALAGRDRAGPFEAAALVDAAGAWADELATMAAVAPLALSPKRRTAILFEPSTMPIPPGRW
jgi:D-arginine dehydrogenase